MRIDELNLISFGKFQDKHIKLKDGLNIIYGENEKGKSTVHGFIEGIFYGFLKPYVKRTLYRDEFEKYSPWNKQSYRGNMALNFKGEDYIIEANDMLIGDDEVFFYINKELVFIAYKKNLDYIRILQPHQITFKQTHK